MDDWEKFLPIILPEKEKFNCNLDMEDITDANYIHAKRVCKDFEIKNLGKYYDFDLKSVASLLAVFFKNLRKICSKIYH